MHSLRVYLKVFFFYNKKDYCKGFTLIELLVVIIILGILAVVSMPNLIKQAGKSREVEFKNIIGTINRAQQTYHWEKQIFASAPTDAQALELLSVSFDEKYIDTYNIVDNVNYATVRPENFDYNQDQTRGFSGGMYYNADVYNGIICQGYEPADSVSPPTNAGVCGPDAEELK